MEFLCPSFASSDLGLSQKDLALSKKAEMQLEQERRDKELALELQVTFIYITVIFLK